MAGTTGEDVRVRPEGGGQAADAPPVDGASAGTVARVGAPGGDAGGTDAGATDSGAGGAGAPSAAVPAADASPAAVSAADAPSGGDGRVPASGADAADGAAPSSDAAGGVEPAGDTAVFVDPSGRRLSRMRRVGRLVAAGCVCAGATLGLAVTGGDSTAPWLRIPGPTRDDGMTFGKSVRKSMATAATMVRPDRANAQPSR
ncbi:hypothetical protein ABT329_15525, partial [Streptomyces minutiscleroticus]